MMALAVFVGQAFAADPVATWTDFNMLTSEGYTLTMDADCTVNADGSITLGGAGLTLPFSTDGSPVTVVMEVSNVPSDNCTLIDYALTSGNHVSLFDWEKSQDGSILEQWWNTSKYDTEQTRGDAVWPTDRKKRRTVAFTYDRGFGTTTYIDGKLLLNCAKLVQADYDVSTIYIGSLNRGVVQNKATGMTVHSLRVYNSKLSADDVATETRKFRTIVGGDTPGNTVEVSDKIEVNQGEILRTIGYLKFLNGENVVNAGGTLEVVSGETAFNMKKEGLAGTLKVNSGAKFLNGTADGPSYGAVTLDIAGTLEITGGVRWSLGSASTTILREGATLKGDGANDTHKYAYDYFDGHQKIQVLGNATIEGNIGSHNTDENVICFDIDQDKTLTMKGTVGRGKVLVKKGTFSLEDSEGKNAEVRALTIAEGGSLSGNGSLNGTLTYNSEEESVFGGEIKSDLTVEAGVLEFTANQKSTGIGNVAVNGGVLRINTESDRADANMAVPERKVISVGESGILELAQGYAYLTAEGAGLTKVVGNFYLGITGDSGLNKITTKLEIENGKTLFVRNWRSDHALNPAALCVNGSLKEEGYSNPHIKPFSVKTSNLSGTGRIDVPVTLADGATLAGSVTVNRAVTVAGTVTVHGEAGQTVLTCNNAADIAANLTAPAGLECVVVDGKIVLAKKPVVKIGETTYATFAEALAAASAMTGDVTVEILDKVTLNGPLSGSYSSIKFVGATENAEIYLDVQGYIEAPGKNVAFENLKLSKVAGGYITNAGFMNLAFGIYGATEVTYTNCTFLNGAYASSGKNTFTGCTFYRSHDRYGLWAYGAEDIVVDGCTFADIRGIKMFDEGKAGTTSITVKNTDFTAADNKPAIVLTYGQSVTLENNTYSSKGVFELDLDGAPNGVTVTSDVAPACVNDNGACGVLVDGKIYTTAAQAAEVATAGSNVTLLHNSAETVEFAVGVNLDKNNFEAAGVTVAQPVAKIGDVGYVTFDEAVAAANEVVDEQVTIILLKDTTFEGDDLYADLILDLNGKTITATGSYVFWFEGGSLIVKDSSAEKTGKIDGAETVSNAFLLWGDDELTIESGIIHANNNVIYTYGSGNAVTINGGELKSYIATGNIFYLTGEGNAITVKDGLFIGNVNPFASGLSISGGAFTADVAAYCEYGKTVELIDGLYNVVDAQNTVFIGEAGYISLEDALNAAKTGDTIEIKAPGSYTLKNKAIEEGAYRLPSNLTIKGLVDGVVVVNGPAIRANNITIDNVDFINPVIGNYQSGLVFHLTGESAIKNCDVYGYWGASYYSTVSGTLYIENCNFDSEVYGLHIAEGNAEVTVVNSVIAGWNTYGAGIRITFDGCTFDDDSSYAYLGFYGNAVIEDCKFEENVTIGSQTTEAIVIDISNSKVVDDNGTVVDQKSIHDIIEQGTLDSDVVVKIDNVHVNGKAAKIGDTTYATLSEAFAAVQNGETVKLLADVAATETITVAGKSITLDLNGKTISGVCNASQSCLVYVENNAALTVKDSAGNGKLAYAQGASNVGWTVDVKGAFVLESGTVELTGSWSIGYAVDVRPNAWGTAYVNPTVFTMNGGNIVSSDGGVRVASSSDSADKNVSASFVMKGGKIDAAWDGVFIQQSDAIYDNLAFEITGGTIESDLNPVRVYGPAPTGYVSGQDCMNIALKGGTLEYTGTEAQTWVIEGILRVGGGSSVETILANGEFVVAESIAQSTVAPEGFKWVSTKNGYTLAACEYVAQIGDVKYEYLAEAIAAAQNGQTLKLLSDLEVIGETFTIAADKAITLDMNGKKITATDNKAVNVSYELFYIYGGLTVTGTGTIELISTSNDTAWAKSSTIFHNRGGVLTIENGSFTHKGGTAMAFVVDNNANSYGDAYLYVNGGEIISENYIAIRMRMEDPNANGNPGNGISYAAVSGGYIYGANRGIWGQKSSGANEKQGELTVTGGVVENGRADRGAIQIDVDSYEAQNMLVSISGSATIKGAIMGGDDEFVVSGGTFTVEVPEKYCAAGYKVEANQDGTFGVVVDPAYGKVAKIGDTYYATLAEAIAAAQGDTVKLLANVALNEVIAIEKVITLDLNGYTVTGANKAVVFQIKADTTIVNGKIVGNKTGTSSGLLEIYANLNMNGVTVETSSIKAMAFKEGGFTAVLTDCTVTGGLKGYGASVWQIYGGTYYVGSSASSEHLNGTVEVYGGTFHYELRSKDCAPGYEVVDNGDGTWTVAYNPACFVDTNNNGVLDDGEAIYGSLDEIFETLRSGDVYIVLLRDVEVGKQVDTNVNAKYYLNAAEDVTVTFKHETGVLSGDVAASEQAWNFIQNMYIGENVTLNAKYMLLWGDVEIAGTVNTTYLYALGATVDVLSTGKVNVNSGEATVQVKTNTTFTVDGELNTTLLQVWTENAKLIINGEVSARTIRAWDENPSIVVANDATVNAKFNLSDNASVQGPAGLDITTDVADHKIAYENGEYKIVERVYVAQIGDVKYESLAEAFKAGGDIILLNDVVVSATIKVERNTTVTLDLNGKTIDGTGKVRIAIMSYGDLTIKDSSEEKTGVVKAGIDTAGNCVNICAGSFTLESGNIYSLNNGILIDEEAATVTVNGGKITAEPKTNNSAAFYISSASETIVNIAGGELVGYNGILLWNNTKLNITGGSIDAKGRLAIQGNGSRDNTEIAISGNAKITGREAAIYHPQGGKLTISGGEVTGETGVIVKGGNVTISGGTITATGAAGAYEPVSSGFKGTGDALYVEHYDNSANSENYGTPTVTITGGTFVSANGQAVASYANPNGDVEALEKFISGGTFATKPNADYCAEGFTPVKVEGGYSVGILPDAEVTNLGSITVGLGDYTAEMYKTYDLIGGSGLQSAEVPYDLTLAMDFKAKDTAAEAAQNAFGNYTTDFFITMSGMSQASFVGDGCYLAGYYPSFNAWVKIPLDGFTVENGKVYPVITSAGFDFKYTDICDTVGQFICGIYLTPEVLAANPNLTVDLTLGLAENKDAALNAQFFKVDNYEYDADDLQPVTLPEVVITDIKNTLTDADPDLTFALNFAIKDADKLTDAYLEKLFAKYGNYYTDYVLTISGLTDPNGSVKFNANGNGDGYLAGQYDAWSKSWVTVPFSDVTVKNGQSFYIMEYAAELMGKGGLRFTLKEIAEIVKNFDCGVYFTPEFLAANPNLKVDLELKVFTEDENGNKVGDISVATNTFDKDDFSVEAAKLDIRIVNGKPQIGFAGEGKLVLNAATALTGEWTKNVEYTAVENDGDDTKTWVTPKDGYYFFKGYIVR